jgi:CPA2 family monovalent cation:H+ antiporter-2
VQAAVAVGIIVLSGRYLVRPLFRLVAAAHSTELFIATVLFVIIAAAVVAHQAGLSMALGSFIAGLLLAETEFRKAIQASIEPFQGLLLGVFFFTVGMRVDVRELVQEPLLLLACVRRPHPGKGNRCCGSSARVWPSLAGRD